MKEASLERLHLVWFQLWDTGEKAQDTATRPKKNPQKIHGCRGFMGKAEQEEHRGFRAVKILCVNVVAFVQLAERPAPAVNPGTRHNVSITRPTVADVPASADIILGKQGEEGCMGTLCTFCAISVVLKLLQKMSVTV